MSTASGRYDRVSIWLHWTIGLGIVAIAVIELLRGELFAKGSVPREALKALHDPAGTIIFALILLRVVWRLTHPVPALPPGMHTWERLAAKLTHVSLYLLIVVMPLLGFAATFARGRPVDFGLFQIASPLSVSVSRDVARALKEAHGYLAEAILVIAFIHALAALWHHYVRKDDVLTRCCRAVLSIFVELSICPAEMRPLKLGPPKEAIRLKLSRRPISQETKEEKTTDENTSARRWPISIGVTLFWSTMAAPMEQPAQDNQDRPVMVNGRATAAVHGVWRSRGYGYVVRITTTDLSFFTSPATFAMPTQGRRSDQDGVCSCSIGSWGPMRSLFPRCLGRPFTSSTGSLALPPPPPPPRAGSTGRRERRRPNALE